MLKSTGQEEGNEEKDDKPDISMMKLDDLTDDEVVWNINDNAIGPLPPFHPPMDKKCVTFVHERNVEVVAERISNSLREMSIVAEYESATVRAITSDRVRFIIHLYRGSNASFSNGIIVECIRVRGCVRSFHKVCRSILTKAKGDATKDKCSRINNRPAYFSRGAGVNSSPCLMNNNNELTSTELGIEVAWSLLKKDRLDANVLGMESMVNLTTPDVATGDEALLLSAHAVLGVKFNLGNSNTSYCSLSSSLPPSCKKEGLFRNNDVVHSIEGEEEDERFAEIHHLIISLIRDHKLSTSSYSRITTSSSLRFLQGTSVTDDEDDFQSEKHLVDCDDSDDEDQPDMEDIEHISTMRSLAYQALLNSLQAAVKLSSASAAASTSVSLHNRSSFLRLALNKIVSEENIVPCLIDEITKTFQDSSSPGQKATGLNAHDATLAIQIFHILVEYSTLVQQYIVKNYNNSLKQDVFCKAYRVGCKRHANLEKEILKVVNYVESVLMI